MRTIDITTILGTELKSRTSARDFATYLRNMEVKEAAVDFSRVNSVTRSFMDEFYQLLIKPGRSLDVNIELQKMNHQAAAFLSSVKQTSTRPRTFADAPSNNRFISLHTIQQLNEYLDSVTRTELLTSP